MKIIQTTLPGVTIFEPRIFTDERGFFLETYRESVFRDAGIENRFTQDNHSRSHCGVLRGLHYQLIQPQGKLIRVTSGSIFDVAVDIRTGSPTFGDWYGSILDESNMRLMYVPPGFAHGFVVLSGIADVNYKCTSYYHPQSERGIIWNDPKVGIKWPILDVTLSNADSQHPMLENKCESQLPVY